MSGESQPNRQTSAEHDEKTLEFERYYSEINDNVEKFYKLATEDREGTMTKGIIITMTASVQPIGPISSRIATAFNNLLGLVQADFYDSYAQRILAAPSAATKKVLCAKAGEALSPQYSGIVRRLKDLRQASDSLVRKVIRENNQFSVLNPTQYNEILAGLATLREQSTNNVLSLLKTQSELLQEFGVTAYCQHFDETEYRFEHWPVGQLTASDVDRYTH
ncbi:hypothetical protein BJ508DRAFT_335632 [Ascobolus immersus RN42]|uniref:Uncharacterized protein n=1 Tax=Ascobolus immersus RN42 TaxID=1160509 RepID=A0A3N4HBQ9_ASCIM|nr:hypothetical protein BJ508DRAFT_335632 [Ascobolus immersus RN42]